MNIQKVAAFASKTDSGLDGGNPAGVVLINAFPTDEEMIATAAEVGYSETVFAVPIANRNNAYRVRYFSPEGEVPFCGHATIALGAALSIDASTPDSNEVELPTEISFDLALNHAHVGLRVNKTKQGVVVTLISPPTSHQIIDSKEHNQHSSLLQNILSGFDISSDDLDLRFPPAIVNGGSQHLALTLKEQSTLDQMSYDFESVKQHMLQHDLVTIILAKPDLDPINEQVLKIDVRNAFASGGVIEDPATGAAAAAYAGYLRDSNILPSVLRETADNNKDNNRNKKSEYQLTFLQGHHIGMPSVINASLSEEAGSPIALSGYTRLLNEG